MFKAIEDVIEQFAEQEYILTRPVASLIFLSLKMEKPILVEGPAGVGKTMLGEALSGALGCPLIRLQCYEGLDEAKALYEWEYSKQLLYTQILKDKIGEVLAGEKTLADAVKKIGQEDSVFFSEDFILPRPLLKAITLDEQCVLLIDEVDKSDSEFEAFLLEVLSEFQVSVPEIGTIKAKHKPLVILTSNNEREMTDGLKRRCLHLYLDFPDKAQEIKIVRLKVPNIAEDLAAQVVDVVSGLRTLDMKKHPSISETLDWARALTILNVDTLDEKIVNETLNIVLKYEADIQKAQRELASFIKQKKPDEVKPDIKSDLLH